MASISSDVGNLSEAQQEKLDERAAEYRERMAERYQEKLDERAAERQAERKLT